MVRARMTLAALGTILIAPAAMAQTPPPDVQKVFDEAAGAYRNITALSTAIDLVQPGAPAISTQLTLTRGGKLAALIRSGKVVRHVIANGTTIYSDSSMDTKKYLKQPGTKLDDAMDVVKKYNGAGLGLLPILLTKASAERKIIPGPASSVKKEADEKLDGVLCDVVAAVLGEGEGKAKYQFAFGKTDHLLRRIAVLSTAGTPIVTETYKGVTTAVTLKPAMFTYKPAPGAMAVLPPKAPDYFNPALKVGAEPFPLTGSDLAGKSVSLSEYKGKVLLIDFWATWCGPCVAELPNVLEAYKKYHDKGFEIVGISLDQETDKAKLEAFIRAKGVPWRQVYDGKHWKAANAVKYGVQAIPFTLLIGKTGKIAAVGARGEDLAPAIEAALAQK